MKIPNSIFEVLDQCQTNRFYQTIKHQTLPSYYYKYRVIFRYNSVFLLAVVEIDTVFLFLLPAVITLYPSFNHKIAINKIACSYTIKNV